jgi:PAS domain S-box-containing protein
MKNKRMLLAAILIGAFISAQVVFYRYLALEVTELARDPVTHNDRALDVRLYMQAPLLIDMFVICGLIVWVAVWSRGIEDLREARTRNAELRRKLEKERSLDNVEARLRGLLEEAPAAMALLDDEGRLLYANGLARAALQLGRRDIVDVNFADLLPPQAVVSLADLRQTLDKMGPQAIRLSLRDAQGGGFAVAARLALVPQETGGAPLLAMMWEMPFAPAARTDGERASAGLVLVADDEELLRVLLENMLARMGYGAVLAANGQEAVELFAANRDRVTAVVLDLAMPILSGEAAAERIREMAPRVPILFCTGASPVRSDAPSDIKNRCLNKPFGFEDFQLALQNVISEEHGRDA